MQTLTFDDARLIVADNWGVYIPQRFCEGMDSADSARLNVDHADVLVCQAGPEQEWYWEAWQNILDSATVTDSNGQEWGLYQNGDLWECPIGCEISQW
jgi:hypothetical protein